MTAPGRLEALGIPLMRAAHADLPALVELQQAAYARNRALLGVEPLPLLADYEALFQTQEIWLARSPGCLDGAIMLEARADDLLLWSISIAPAAQGRGLGHALLAAVDARARALGLATVRLYTGATLNHLIDWYGRNGYAVEQIEQLPDRAITHMVKRLG